MDTGFKGWLAKQSLPVEAAVVTTTSAVHGAAVGGFMGTLTLYYYYPLLCEVFAGGPFVQARDIAVFTGTEAGISCVMKRLRGKEDVQSSMVAAFGSCAMYALVSRVGGPNLSATVISGLIFALYKVGIYQLRQKFWQPPDVNYVKTRTILCNLGLQNYEKNFKKGLLIDNTLPLLTDSALRDAKIPPGPRLLILDHIERDPELKERRQACR